LVRYLGREDRAEFSYVLRRNPRKGEGFTAVKSWQRKPSRSLKRVEVELDCREA
jgi:hypothetical protein